MTSDRMYPGRPVVGVGAVVVVSKAEAARIAYPGTVPEPVGVVLIKRRFEPRAGEWSLPGGALEVGETLDACVAREIAEETGLTIAVGPVIEVFDRIVLDPDAKVKYHFVLVDYLCRPIGGRLQHGSDTSDVTVADPARLEPFALTAKAQAVIARALEMTSGWERQYNHEPTITNDESLA
jgi:8-oxo-dGTP diphosphatase